MKLPALAPDSSPGWTHIWDGTTQLAISDEVAAALAYLGIIRYSGDYRVYRPTGEWDNPMIQGNLVQHRDNVTVERKAP